MSKRYILRLYKRRNGQNGQSVVEALYIKKFIQPDAALLEEVSPGTEAGHADLARAVQLGLH